MIGENARSSNLSVKDEDVRAELEADGTGHLGEEEEAGLAVLEGECAGVRQRGPGMDW